MKPLLILCLVLLASCASAPDTRVPPLVESKKTVEFDERLLQDCPPLPKLEDATDEKIIAVAKSWLDIYSACRTNKNKLNTLTREAFNLKEKK